MVVVGHLVKKLSPFMKPEGSMLCSQQPTIQPYFEPDEFVQHPYTLFL